MKRGVKPKNKIRELLVVAAVVRMRKQWKVWKSYVRTLDYEGLSIIMATKPIYVLSLQKRTQGIEKL